MNLNDKIWVMHENMPTRATVVGISTLVSISSGTKVTATLNEGRGFYFESSGPFFQTKDELMISTFGITPIEVNNCEAGNCPMFIYGKSTCGHPSGPKSLPSGKLNPPNDCPLWKGMAVIKIKD